MAKYQSEQLLDQLAADVRRILLQVENLKNLSNSELRQKPATDSWSVVEVLAHLNFYARFYVDAMETQLAGHSTKSRKAFQPGWFGNYFTRMVGPAPNGELQNKMKTFKAAVPAPPSNLDPVAEMQEFTQHQHHLLNLLQIARSADLEAVRVPISLTRLIRLKLGDTFRFVIAHEQRHFQQIDRVMAILKLQKNSVAG